ncbi:hypothetical protein ALQ56_200415 [Pseudomonas syringae pv. papulans]|nr:hypothetical protein ALQ56_200415 [Pseudomonas syringae pv. papulans]
MVKLVITTKQLQMPDESSRDRRSNRLAVVKACMSKDRIVQGRMDIARRMGKVIVLSVRIGYESRTILRELVAGLLGSL